jgi:hypothetical protein
MCCVAAPTKQEEEGGHQHRVDVVACQHHDTSQDGCNEHDRHYSNTVCMPQGCGVLEGSHHGYAANQKIEVDLWRRGSELSECSRQEESQQSAETYPRVRSRLLERQPVTDKACPHEKLLSAGMLGTTQSSTKLARL